MSTIQTATEGLIRLTKQAIHPDTVLVFTDDLFEVQRTPSVILQGPKLTEDRFRRGQARLFEKNTPDLSFEECRFPRLYHLDSTVAAASERMTRNMERIKQGTMMLGAGLSLITVPAALVGSTAATQKALGMAIRPAVGF